MIAGVPPWAGLSQDTAVNTEHCSGLALFFLLAGQNTLSPSSHETEQAGNMNKIPASTFLKNVVGICFPLGNIHYSNYIPTLSKLASRARESRKHKTIIFLFVLNFVKVKTYFC